APARRGLPSIDNSWNGFLGQAPEPHIVTDNEGDEEVPEPEPAIRWVAAMELITGALHGRGPILSYAHLAAPHVPWVTNPSGSQYEHPEQYSEVEGIGEGGAWMANPGPALTGYQRHLYQLGLVDRLLGDLFDRLEATGTWEETMVIVVADHGASFVPEEHRRWPYEDNRDDLYRIPLF